MEQHDFDESIIEDNRRAIDDALAERGKRFEFIIGRDLPMLLYVRNATFVSNEQMCEAFVSSKREANRQSFRWRLQRLIDGKLIRVMEATLPYKGRVYAITRYGLQVLESCGEGLIHLTSESRSLPHERQVAHFLELNEIRRTFEKTKTLQGWQTECELTTRNYNLRSPNAKDYDAVAKITLAGNSYTLAIEYERTLKSSARYEEIAESLVDENNMDAVLYFAPTVKDVFALEEVFRKSPIPLLFACAWTFKATAYSSNVLLRYGKMRETCTVAYALENVVLPVK